MGGSNSSKFFNFILLAILLFASGLCLWNWYILRNTEHSKTATSNLVTSAVLGAVFLIRAFMFYRSTKGSSKSVSKSDNLSDLEANDSDADLYSGDSSN